MIHRELFFATPVYVKDVGTPEYNKYLEEQIVNWSKKDPGLQKTNTNGWHSPTDMHLKPEYKNLIEELHIAQQEIYKDECLEGEPFLGNMWANINYKGGYNRPHIHPNSLWSGVYYVKTPKKCGHLKIEDTRTMSLMSRPKKIKSLEVFDFMKKINKEEPKHLWREVHFEPIAGRLIMFPSWVNHCVDPNESDDIRISVSFNFLQKGLMV
jgi:uncharacterized protein (TIGR02466 family)